MSSPIHLSTMLVQCRSLLFPVQAVTVHNILIEYLLNTYWILIELNTYSQLPKPYCNTSTCVSQHFVLSLTNISCHRVHAGGQRLATPLGELQQPKNAAECRLPRNKIHISIYQQIHNTKKMQATKNWHSPTAVVICKKLVWFTSFLPTRHPVVICPSDQPVLATSET